MRRFVREHGLEGGCCATFAKTLGPCTATMSECLDLPEAHCHLLREKSQLSHSEIMLGAGKAYH